MNPDDYLSRYEARLREKQALCSHPSLKCSLCDKYHDNIQNDYKAEIDILMVVLDHYEALLDIHKVPHPKYREWLQNGKIEEYRKEVMRMYRLKYERYSDEL